MIEFLTALFMLLTPLPGDSECHRVLFAASAIASEGAAQPFEAQVNIARAVRDNAPCGDTNYLSGYRIALSTNDVTNYHYRAYFNLGSFAKEWLMRWIMAAFLAYTEYPRIPIRHFDAVGSTARWWNSPRACPEGITVIGGIQFC